MKIRQNCLVSKSVLHGLYKTDLKGGSPFLSDLLYCNVQIQREHMSGQVNKKSSEKDKKISTSRKSLPIVGGGGKEIYCTPFPRQYVAAPKTQFSKNYLTNCRR